MQQIYYVKKELGHQSDASAQKGRSVVDVRTEAHVRRGAFYHGGSSRAMAYLPIGSACLL